MVRLLKIFTTYNTLNTLKLQSVSKDIVVSSYEGIYKILMTVRSQNIAYTLVQMHLSKYSVHHWPLFPYSYIEISLFQAYDNWQFMTDLYKINERVIHGLFKIV